MRSWISSLLGALALAASPALANDVNNIIMPAMGGTTYFAAIHTDDVDFTDVFVFNAVGPLEVTASLVTIGSGASNIDFLSADMNGVALALFDVTEIVETGGTPGVLSFSGPLTLTVRGKSSATGGTFASYTGTMNVASVLIPEPGTLALTLTGLFCLVAATPRRGRRLR